MGLRRVPMRSRSTLVIRMACHPVRPSAWALAPTMTG